MDLALRSGNEIFVPEDLIDIFVKAQDIAGFLFPLNSIMRFWSFVVLYPKLVKPINRVVEENMLDRFIRHVFIPVIHINIQLSMTSWAFFVKEVYVVVAGADHMKV